MFYFGSSASYSDAEIFRAARSFIFKGVLANNPIMDLNEARVVWRVSTERAHAYLKHHKSKTK